MKVTDIMIKGVTLDAMGEGVLSLSVVEGEKDKFFRIEFVPKMMLKEIKPRKKILRTFPSGSCLRATRSFRRFCLLSDEIKAGY